MTHDIEAKVRAFIVERFLFGRGELAAGDSLLEKGVIDSTGVLELVTFLEAQLGVAFEDSELTPENLDSIERIVRFVERKRAQAA